MNATVEQAEGDDIVAVVDHALVSKRKSSQAPC
jgi:hypothetical protein